MRQGFLEDRYDSAQIALSIRTHVGWDKEPSRYSRFGYNAMVKFLVYSMCRII